MINITKEQNLLSEEKWPEIPSVFVKGVPSEPDVDPDTPHEDKVRISQSWQNIAVIRATSDQPTIFYVGFYNMNIAKFVDYEMTTNWEFGMRIGGGDVKFFAIPKDLSKRIKLELVELTREDDPKYKDLPLI